MKTHDWDVGERIHGFAAGAFGRDSYKCRHVEAIGHDWVVTRNELDVVEMVSGSGIPSHEEGNNDCECHGMGWLDR